MIWKARYFRYLTIAFVAGELLWAFRAGIDRGFDHTIGAEAYGRMRFAICSAITDLKHNGPVGHVCNEVLDSVLEYAGLTGQQSILVPLGKKYPENLQDRALLNTVIDKAIAFPILPAHDKYRGAGSDDVGMIDFSKAAFLLFGYNVESLFFTYFLLLFVSILAFIGTFGRRPAYLSALAVVMVAHLAVVRSGIFDFTVFTFGTVTNPRFLSALAIIPGLHIAFSMMCSDRASWRHMTLTSVQAAIIVFAISIRAVALWVLLGTLMLGVFLWLVRRSPRSLWPGAILSALFLAYTAYGQTTLNPVYAEKGGTGYHTVWHSIYYSLQMHPEWDAKYGVAHRHATGDEQPWVGAQIYLAQHPTHAGDPPLYFANGYPNYAGMEKYVRSAFVNFLWDDPKFVLETFFIYKPLVLYQITAKYVISEVRQTTTIGLFVLLVGISVTFFGSHRSELVELSKILGMAVGALIASIAPLLVTVPMISDDFFVLLICFGLWVLVLCSIFYIAGNAVLQRARRRSVTARAD